MSTDVIMPQMGESIAEGTITKWLKKSGDTVQRDEPIFEISTDKVDAEIPSPVAGTLLEIKVPEGQTVAINTVVASIGETAAPGAAVSAPAAPAEPKAEAPAEHKAVAAPPPATSANATAAVKAPEKPAEKQAETGSRARRSGSAATATAAHGRGGAGRLALRSFSEGGRTRRIYRGADSPALF